MACQHPPIPKKPGMNWIERIQGHVPEEIDCVARALYWGSGVAAGDEQRAYHMAFGIAEDWVNGSKPISPEKKAKYVAAIAEWKALIARAHAT